MNIKMSWLRGVIHSFPIRLIIYFKMNINAVILMFGYNVGCGLACLMWCGVHAWCADVNIVFVTELNICTMLPVLSHSEWSPFAPLWLFEYRCFLWLVTCHNHLWTCDIETCHLSCINHMTEWNPCLWKVVQYKILLNCWTYMCVCVWLSTNASTWSVVFLLH